MRALRLVLWSNVKVLQLATERAIRMSLLLPATMDLAHAVVQVPM